MPEVTTDHGSNYRWTPNFPGMCFLGTVVDSVTNQLIDRNVSLTLARQIWPKIHDGRTDAQLEAHEAHWGGRYREAMANGRKAEAMIAGDAWFECEKTINQRFDAQHCQRANEVMS